MKISIIGGGIAGCASAYYLTRAGHDVTLYERDSLASHASGFALGGLIPAVGGRPGVNAGSACSCSQDSCKTVIIVAFCTSYADEP